MGPRVKREAKDEEDRVGRLAAECVRCRRPADAPADVAEAQEAGEAGCDRCDLSFLIGVELIETDVQPDQLPAEHFLQHGRGHAQNADARRNVEAKHPPEQPELRRLPCDVEMHMAVSHHVVGDGGRRREAFRRPTLGRHPIAESAGDHESEIDRRQRDEGLPDPRRGRVA